MLDYLLALREMFCAC